jgi:hypothetical protein
MKQPKKPKQPIINKVMRKPLSELEKYQELIYDNQMSGYAYSEVDKHTDEVKKVILIIDDLEINFYDETDRQFQTENGHKFSSVSRSFNAYAKQNPIENVPFYPSMVFKTNRVDFDKLDPNSYSATDLDHAYWRIAFLLGYISEKLYNSGLKWDKRIRNITMAVLASERKFVKFDNGEPTPNQSIIIKKETLSKMYKNIRHTCYQHMNALMVLLGEDFLCYKTDCIYYVKKAANTKMVMKYLSEHRLLFKIVEPKTQKKGLNRTDD